VLLLLCFAKSNGELLWKGELDTGSELHMKGNDASPSPVASGNRLYVRTEEFLYCIGE